MQSHGQRHEPRFVPFPKVNGDLDGLQKILFAGISAEYNMRLSPCIRGEFRKKGVYFRATGNKIWTNLRPSAGNDSLFFEAVELPTTEDDRKMYSLAVRVMTATNDFVFTSLDSLKVREFHQNEISRLLHCEVNGASNEGLVRALYEAKDSARSAYLRMELQRMASWLNNGRFLRILGEDSHHYLMVEEFTSSPGDRLDIFINWYRQDDDYKGRVGKLQVEHKSDNLFTVRIMDLGDGDKLPECAIKAGYKIQGWYPKETVIRPDKLEYSCVQGEHSNTHF